MFREVAPDRPGLDLFLDGRADKTERLAASEGLLDKLDDFDGRTQQLVITALADLAPSNLLDDSRLTPSQENSSEQNDFLRQALVGAIDQIEPARIAANLGSLAAGWFGDSDETRQQFDQVIVPRLNQIDSIADLDSYSLSYLNPDQQLELLSGVIERGDAVDGLAYAEELFGSDQAKILLIDQADSRPQLAVALLDISSNLPPDKLARVVDGLLDAGHAAKVADGLRDLANNLPPDKLAGVVDNLLEAGHGDEVADNLRILTVNLPPGKLAGVVDNLLNAGHVVEVADNLWALGDLPPDKLAGVVDKAIDAGHVAEVADNFRILAVKLPPGKLAGVVDRLSEVEHAANKIIDCYRLGYLPPPSGGIVTQLTKFMELDERSGLAPEYFQEAIRRLPRVEGKPSFAILFKEAMDTYYQIEGILDGGHEAREMLGRIQATIGRRGPGADRESIALANAVLRQEYDPAEIETALDAKAYPLYSLKQDLGLEIDVSEASIDHLTEAMGDLLPASIYASRSGSAVRTRLGEIVTALANNSYQSLKYPDRQQLIEAGSLPPVDEAAYQRWQTTDITDSAEVVANTAADVSDKIRQVVGPALSSHQQLEDFDHLPDPKAKIEAIGVAMAQIGQQIGATHRQKQHGEISPDQAEAAVAALEAQKQQLELARDAVRLAGVTGSEVASGKLHNEDGRPTQTTIAETLDKLAATDSLSQSSESFDQLRGMLDNYAVAAATDIGRIIVSDVDDYQTTLEIGANPVGSCQHYESGSLSKGLLSYFEPGVKIITVRSDNGGFIARAILRLAFDPDGSPAMILEPIYTSQASNDIESLVKDHAKDKAASMGMRLYSYGSGEDTPITLPRLSGAPWGYSDLAAAAGLYRPEQKPETKLARI